MLYMDGMGLGCAGQEVRKWLGSMGFVGVKTH